MKSYWLRVRLVGDHDDGAAVGQSGVSIALFFREELLDCSEYDTARYHRELLPQISSAVGLHRFLSQEFLAARECAEELVVQVVAVCENHDRRILHRWFTSYRPNIEHHRQTFARTLCVPDDSYAAGLPAYPLNDGWFQILLVPLQVLRQHVEVPLPLVSLPRPRARHGIGDSLPSSLPALRRRPQKQ